MKNKSRKTAELLLPAISGAVLFLAAFYIYTITLSPSDYFGDSGELISMAYTLGVPHPTGFSLYILAGRLFSFLPLANIAFRINLMSAFFAALVPAVLFFTFLIFSRKEKDNMPGIYIPFAVSALFIFGYTMWSQAVVSRIYTFNAFFCVLALFCFIYRMEAEAEPADGALYLLALLTGLGAGLHLSFVYFAGFLWIYLGIKKFGAIKRLFIPIIVFLAAGAGVCIYIAVRGHADIVLKWAGIDNLKDLMDYFAQKQYRAKMFSRDAQGYSYYFGFIKDVIIREFSSSGFVVFIIAVLWAILKKFRYTWLFLAIYFSNIMILAVYGNYTDLYLAFRYLIPSYLTAVFFIYFFAVDFYKSIKNRGIAATAVLGCLIIVLSASLIANFHENDRNNNFMAYNYPHDLLSCIPYNASYIANTDSELYTMAYAKYVEKRFKNIVVFDYMDGTFFTVFGGKDTRQTAFNTGNLAADRIGAFIKNYSPVYSIGPIGNPGTGFSTNGISVKIVDGPAGRDVLWPWKLYSLKGILHDPGIYHGYEEREAAGIYYYKMAQYYGRMGNQGLYAGLLDRAVETAYDSVPVLGSAAVMWSGDTKTPDAVMKAQECFDRAAALDPANGAVIFSAGSFYARIGAWRKAYWLLSRAVKLNPANVTAGVYMEKVQKELEKQDNYQGF
jgi:tetratricopeptide (TPR) repeat protein